MLFSVDKRSNPQAIGRNVGKSTALALLYIGQAINEPNTWHTIQDHHPRGNDELLRIIQDSVLHLRLKFFHYRRRTSNNSYQIRCDIFANDPTEL